MHELHKHITLSFKSHRPAFVDPGCSDIVFIVAKIFDLQMMIISIYLSPTADDNRCARDGPDQLVTEHIIAM